LRLAVADTGPLRYLILIGEVGIIPALIDVVLIPPEVHDELRRSRTPAQVRAWIAAPPPWLHVQPSPHADTNPRLARLDPGERAAITLAMSVTADAVLVDDRAGAAAARAHALAAIGTLGLLQRAARGGLLDLPTALARLVATNFHIRPQLLELLLAEDRIRREKP